MPPFDNIFTRGLTFNPQTGGFTSALLGGIGAPQAQQQGRGPSVLQSLEGGAGEGGGGGGGGGTTTFHFPGVGGEGGGREPSIFGLGTRWLNPKQGSSVGSLFGGWMPGGDTPFEQALAYLSARETPAVLTPKPDIFNPGFQPFRSAGPGGSAGFSDTGQPWRTTAPPPTLGELLGLIPGYRGGFD